MTPTNDGTVSSGWDVLDASHAALRTAVLAVPGDGWHLPTPCEGWTVTQVFQHAVGDQIGYAAALTGGPGPGFDPFAPSGDLAGADPAAVLEDALSRAANAWAGADRDAAELPVPLPPFTLSPWSGSAACGLDAAVHAWDIAVATGRPSPLTPELARPLLTVAREIVEPLRPRGAYVTALAPAPGDDEVAVLLRYLGRDPHWSAA
ncbi:TIGR03086 family metal-binding protein [Streptomyces niveiscabiei]|uniref:TIGR03086 family metal-binding protein n=1 Tax=Streptomyces niveiscabiei TaxID=164115 RepID=UPI0029A47369|nr:TIGR03086 family metal-binding protein [Streptomyces niveiscabiei]MDX3385834.1 TIGR03086 family metal-binding protein [Streptomyces niveiscabiei]